MRTRELCHKLLSNTSIHQKRITVISEIVETILEAKELSVTKVGRKIKNHCQTRSNIRKVDRLYSNPHLASEYSQVSQSIAQWLIKSPRPFLAVDGSKLPNSDWYVLRASLIAEGRAITIFELIYERSKQGSLELYRCFLKGLKGILPLDVKPILITDAEFRTPWFRAVEKLDWDFIGRIRGETKSSTGEEDFETIEEISYRASNKPKCLGLGVLNKQKGYPGYFYLYQAKNKGRHAHTRSGCHSETEKSKRQAKSAAEPWLIFSSLDYPAEQMIKAYSYRMTIEENFRDMKSGRYGLGLKMTFSKQKNRYRVMLILAMLASVIAYLMGVVAELNDYHYQFQSCSTKNKRILSRFFLGCEMIYRNLIFPFHELIKAIDYLQEELYDSFHI